MVITVMRCKLPNDLELIDKEVPAVLIFRQSESLPTTEITAKAMVMGCNEATQQEDELEKA
jgi:hypothetical protein